MNNDTMVVASTFTTFSEAVQFRFLEMSEGELFVVKADDIFDRYLAAFPAGSNPMFRQRTEHDCQCCKQFIRRLGVVVSVKNGKMITVWGDLDLQAPYKQVADALDAYVRTLPIESVFRTTEKSYGISHNYDKKDNQRYDHFHGVISSKHFSAKDADTQRGERNTVFQVCKRGLNEFRDSDLDMVIDLIDSNSLYRGEEHRPAIIGFRELLRAYKASGSSDLFIWENLDNRNTRFRNTVIGTMLVDLAEGKDIEAAVKAFELKVAPGNYKRTTSLITKGMVDKALQTINELDLGGAIQRRYARMSDVTMNDVLFADKSVRGSMKGGLAAILESSIKPVAPDLKKAIPISAEAFLKDVLPGTKSMEVFVENRHTGNFVSLTGSDDQKPLFRWGNNFAWSYSGDFADSVKQRVKAAGGNVQADLRLSLSWFNLDDLDLHAECPYGHVYYGDKDGNTNTNILDVDMNAGSGKTRNAVENLAFNRPRDGVYHIYVEQFCRRETIDFGFAIEIEFDGIISQYSYPKAMQGHEQVKCFTLTVKGGKVVDVKTPLTGGTSSQDKWGIKTQTLVPVDALMYSPNHWGDNKVGAKHVIFILRDCKNPEPTRGIYNEYLRPDLEKHRKVFEVLGSKTKCQPTDDQLSGVGFTAARDDTVTVVVDGGRSYTLKF